MVTKLLGVNGRIYLTGGKHLTITGLPTDEFASRKIKTYVRLGVDDGTIDRSFVVLTPQDVRRLVGLLTAVLDLEDDQSKEGGPEDER